MWKNNKSDPLIRVTQVLFPSCLVTRNDSRRTRSHRTPFATSSSASSLKTILQNLAICNNSQLHNNATKIIINETLPISKPQRYTQWPWSGFNSKVHYHHWHYINWNISHIYIVTPLSKMITEKRANWHKTFTPAIPLVLGMLLSSASAMLGIWWHYSAYFKYFALI